MHDVLCEINRVSCTIVVCGSEYVHFEYLILEAEVGGKIWFNLLQRGHLWTLLGVDLLYFECMLFLLR